MTPLAPTMAPALASLPMQAPTAPTAKEDLCRTARAFEAIFVRQMLSAARKASFGESLFASQGQDTFRQMQDERFAEIAAERGVFGIAAMLERHLAAQPGATPGGED